jgi:hypothetical protein
VRNNIYWTGIVGLTTTLIWMAVHERIAAQPVALRAESNTDNTLVLSFVRELSLLSVDAVTMSAPDNKDSAIALVREEFDQLFSVNSVLRASTEHSHSWNVSHRFWNPGDTSVDRLSTVKTVQIASNHAADLQLIGPENQQRQFSTDLFVAENGEPSPTKASGSQTRPSPLERPMWRLFGFETAKTLERKDLVISTGGTTFNNPNDIRNVLFGDENRSNDQRFIGVDYGITNNVQISVGVGLKDDTIFSNLVRDPSSLYFYYSAAPAQVKWQFWNRERLQAAVILGAEIPFRSLNGNTESDNFAENLGARQVLFTTDPSGVGSAANALIAEDGAIVFGLALPVSYGVTNKFRLHASPQISFYRDDIPVNRVRGDVNTLIQQDIGFDGSRLNYYGTIFGIGLGLEYNFSRKFQLAADVTPILTGRNSASDRGDDSLFVKRPVWNAGVRWTPNSRTAVNLYATNRFGLFPALPANLLAQPGGEYGIGFDVMYLPDVAGNYAIDVRDTYPQPETFLAGLTGFSSATLPINTTVYQLAYGRGNQITPTFRIGLLDDVELIVSLSRTDDGLNAELPTQGFFAGRLALRADDGQRLFSAALGLGLVYGDSRDNKSFQTLDLNLPLGFRPSGALGERLIFSATPKLALPAQTSGSDVVLGLALGANWKIARNTQFLFEVTPIVAGNNQLVESPQQLNLDGKTVLFGLGVRQMFPAGNSLYALDLYLSNSAGESGLQGITALPNSDLRFGLRFNILNGVPVTTARPSQPAESQPAQRQP